MAVRPTPKFHDNPAVPKNPRNIFSANEILQQIRLEGPKCFVPITVGKSDRLTKSKFE